MSSTLRNFARVADDLPFLPDDPYERRGLQLSWRAALIAVLVIGAYAFTLGGDWLWQDDQLIVNDLRLRTVGGLLAIWKGAPSAATPPLATTLWWIERALSRGSATGFRTVGLLMHAATCVLLWLSMRRLGVAASWMIAVVIAIHPAFVSFVAWPSRQDVLLGAVLMATGLFAWVRARQIEPSADAMGGEFRIDEPPESSRWWSAIFALSALATLLASPMAALVLAVVLSTIAWVRDLETSTATRAVISLYAAVAIAMLVFLSLNAARSTELGMSDVGATPTLSARMLEPVASLPGSLVKVLWLPAAPFLFDRDQWSARAVGAAAVVAGILVAAALVAVHRNRKLNRSFATIALSIIVVSWAARLAVALFQRPTSFVLLADVIDYWSMFGWVGLIIGGLHVALRRLDAGRALAARWGIDAALVIGMLLATLFIARPYARIEQLWADTVARNPSSVIARALFASWNLAADHPDRAADALEQIAPERRTVPWLLARGQTYEAQLKPDDAIACYADALQRAPTRPDVTIALAEAQRRAGRPGAAVLLYERFIARGNAGAAIHNNLGLARASAGDANAAVDAYNAALKIDPSYIAARLNLANALFDLGRFQESSEQLHRAVESDPRNFVAFMNAGSMLYRLQNQSSAERMFRAAVSLDPDSADAHDRLGVTLAAQGNLREAIFYFTRATKLRPGDATLETHLADASADAARRAATQPVR